MYGKRRMPRHDGAESYQITRIEEARDTRGREEVRYVRVRVLYDADEAKREADRLQREWDASYTSKSKPAQFIVDIRERIGGRWEVIEDAWYSARG